VAGGFQAKEDGNMGTQIRASVRHREGAMVKWMAEQAWIGSRLTTTGKYPIDLLHRLRESGEPCEHPEKGPMT
jgi:hypothetical protein